MICSKGWGSGEGAAQHFFLGSTPDVQASSRGQGQLHTEPHPNLGSRKEGHYPQATPFKGNPLGPRLRFTPSSSNHPLCSTHTHTHTQQPSGPGPPALTPAD